MCKELKDIQKSIYILYLYINLYTQPARADTPKLKRFLDFVDLPAIGEQQNNALVAEIMIEELNSAISKFKANKAPVTDSYSSEWYKIFRPQITPMLLNCFNYISMSRFVWNSRGPRIRFKALHLVKEKRGEGSTMSSGLLLLLLCSTIETFSMLVYTKLCIKMEIPRNFTNRYTYIVDNRK